MSEPMDDRERILEEEERAARERVERNARLLEEERQRRGETPDEEPLFADTETAAVDKEERKRAVKRILLILLIVTAVLATLFLIFGKNFNFYRRGMRNLEFDYRDGEGVQREDTQNGGEYSLALAGRYATGKVRIEAYSYGIDTESGETLDYLSEFDYLGTASEETLTEKSCSSDMYLSSESKFRKDAETGEVGQKRGGKYETSADLYFPGLRDFCVSASSRGRSKLSFHESYDTTVGANSYTCEVWLLEDDTGAPVYYTLYRYFSAGELCAVRVLRSDSTLMEIYDIREITSES